VISYLYWRAVRGERVKGRQRQADSGQRYAQTN